MITVEEITPQAMVSWPCRTTPISVCTMEASLGRPSPNACNVQPWRLCTSPAVTLALLREPSSGSFPQLGSGGPWCSPQVGTPTTSCPLTCHRPSDAVTWPGGQVPAPDTSSGNTPPFPALTCHWIRTEEVVCGVWCHRDETWRLSQTCNTRKKKARITWFCLYLAASLEICSHLLQSPRQPCGL